MGFEPTNLGELRLPTGARSARELFAEFLERIDRYDETRDFPAVKGPSFYGVAPALRHRVDPRARRHGAPAGGAGQCGRHRLNWAS